MKPLQIFKAGKHVASDGRVFAFTEADVKAMAAAYDPTLHEAPLVVGHPKDNAPAYGWAKSLSFADGALCATPDQVNAEFAELVNSGAFKKISTSFYAPDAPENPKPGVYYVRHIGFLGAKPPAVKGLKNAEFAADEKGVVSFMDWSDRDNATLWRSLRDWIIGKFGKDEADKIIPDYLVTSLQESAVSSDDTTDAVAGVSYSERTDDVLTKEQKEELERRERELKAKEDAQKQQAIEFAEREKKVKDAEAAQRRVLIASEVDALVVAGKILPKDKAGLVAFMETLDGATVIEFGEGDKKEKKPTREWLSSFLKNLPKAVEFKERGAGGSDAVELSGTPEQQGAELARLAVEFQESEKKAGRTVEIAHAIANVKAKLAK